jgi:hypothetical protein
VVTEENPKDPTPMNVSVEMTVATDRREVTNVGTAPFTVPSLYFKKSDDAKLGKRLGEDEEQPELGCMEAGHLEPRPPYQTIPNCF